MGRKRKKEVKILKRTLPSLYLCPRCGKNSVKATIFKKEVRAIVVCSSCSLKASFTVEPNLEEVDVYNIFIDNYYKPKSSDDKVVA